MKRSNVVIAVAAILCLGGIVAITTRKSGDSPEKALVVQGSSNRSATRSEAPVVMNLPAGPLEVASVDGAEQAPREAPEPSFESVQEFDPEMQPRAFISRDFRNLTEVPDGFHLEGVILTENGFQLEPGDGTERWGTILGPTETFAFPSNAFTPMWLENLPEGTDLFIEVAFSPDGKEWSDWRFAEPDEDSMYHMSPTYPDGTPNPNYGYIPAGIFAWGEDQWDHLRYRITMHSENANSPTVGAYRIFHQDSTMGGGRPGDIARHAPPPYNLDPPEPEFLDLGRYQ